MRVQQASFALALRRLGFAPDQHRKPFPGISPAFYNRKSRSFHERGCTFSRVFITILGMQPFTRRKMYVQVQPLDPHLAHMSREQAEHIRSCRELCDRKQRRHAGPV